VLGQGWPYTAGAWMRMSSAWLKGWPYTACVRMCNSVPAGLKNSFLMFGRFELGHKPAMIVAVSSGDDVLTRWLNYV